MPTILSQYLDGLKSSAFLRRQQFFKVFKFCFEITTTASNVFGLRQSKTVRFHQFFMTYLENINLIDARLETSNLNLLYQTGVFFSV